MKIDDRRTPPRAVVLAFALAACAVNLHATGDPSAARSSPPPSSSQPSSGVSVSPAALIFAARTAGTSSAIEYVTVTNRGSSTLFFSNIVMRGPFAFGGMGSCGDADTVAPRASCTISVQFRPAAAGAATGAVTITDNAGTQTLALRGSGIDSSRGSTN